MVCGVQIRGLELGAEKIKKYSLFFARVTSGGRLISVGVHTVHVWGSYPMCGYDLTAAVTELIKGHIICF